MKREFLPGEVVRRDEFPELWDVVFCIEHPPCTPFKLPDLKTMNELQAKPVWRIEARKHAFAPWRTIKHWHTIETAPAECAVLKRRFHLYAVRVRAN